MTKAGLSIRFVQSYDASKAPMTEHGVNLDTAIMIATMWDDRDDVPFPQKLADAVAYIKSRTH